MKSAEAYIKQINKEEGDEDWIQVPDLVALYMKNYAEMYHEEMLKKQSYKDCKLKCRYREIYQRSILLRK